MVGQWLNVFLRRSDVLKIACLAQIVNVISPITTTRDGLLKHSTYYPLMLVSNLAVGDALDVAVNAPSYETEKFGEMPLLDVSASYDEANNKQAVFIVNRSQSENLPVDLCWQDLTPKSIDAVHQMAGTDPKAVNSFEKPDVIKAVPVDSPSLDGQSATINLPPLSFTALEISL